MTEPTEQAQSVWSEPEWEVTMSAGSSFLVFRSKGQRVIGDGNIRIGADIYGLRNLVAIRRV